MQIFCCTCNTDIDCSLVTGMQVYPHRYDLRNMKFYRCPVCKNFVGTHKGTEIPLGVIANEEIKNARMHIHSLLDPIWRSGKVSRRKCYKLISNKLGYEYHTANLKSIDECRNVYSIILRLKRELSV